MKPTLVFIVFRRHYADTIKMIVFERGYARGPTLARL